MSKNQKPEKPPRARKPVAGGKPSAKSKPRAKADAEGASSGKGDPESQSTQSPRKRRVVFKLKADPGSSVFVAGTFNGWNPEKHPLKDKSGNGEFTAQIYAAPGPLEYKFIINGTWVIDARCPAWTPNSLGSLNSRIDVR